MLLAGVLGACAPEPEVAFCDSGFSHRYDADADELMAWPDDIYTTTSASSPTGRVVTVEGVPWAEAVPPLVGGLVAGLERVSGFGRIGGLLLRFTGDIGDLPTTAAESLTYDGLQLLDLSTTPPTRRPYRVEYGLLRDQITLRPIHPLAPGAEHALVLTSSHQTASGACVTPSATQQALLTGGDVPERYADMAPRYEALPDAMGVAAGEISAALLFTTQDDTRTIASLADHAAAETYTWSQGPTCDDDRQCDGTYTAWDYRHDRTIDGSEPTVQWELPVRIWLPEGEGPFPVLFYGHGMNGDLGYGEQAFDYLADALGMAVVAQNAVEHGDHPTSEGTDLQALPFLGIDLNAFTIDGLLLRGHFNQSAFDRLQTLHLLQDNPDVDGDGLADLDMDRVAYYGGSLGAMLGPALLTMTDTFEAADLPLAGGDLILFATDGFVGAAFVEVFVQLLGGEDGFRRLLPVAQTLVDAGDPAVWSAHVLEDRLVGERAPDVLMPVSLTDEVVPPPAGRAMARALKLPHLQPVAESVDGLEPVEGALTANAGGVTAAYFQFDRVSEGDGAVPSNHDNLQWSPEGRWMARQFFESWLADGRATIREPYGPVGTP
jgi:hypothetical protein